MSAPRDRSRLRRVPRLVRARRRAGPGSAPGTLVADPQAAPPRIRVTTFGPDAIADEVVSDPGALRTLIGGHPVVWVDVCGLGDAGVVSAVGEVFGLHPLSLEDVLHVDQRPKVESFADHAFIVMRTPGSGDVFFTEQVSLFVGPDFVVTFQERPDDCFEPVRQRLVARRGRIRDMGADYLAYALLDVLIDSFFPVLESFGERLEALETDILDVPEPHEIRAVHELKRELLVVRRVAWPMRELFAALTRQDARVFGPQTALYLRDCYDHAIQLMDLVETYREIASGLVDVYLSSLNARMNEIMKVLTIIATIFIPLSFIASLYGMNFAPEASPWNMPELRWYFGYPFALGLMAAVAASLLWYFRRRGWLGGADRTSR